MKFYIGFLITVIASLFLVTTVMAGQKGNENVNACLSHHNESCPNENVNQSNENGNVNVPVNENTNTTVNTNINQNTNVPIVETPIAPPTPPPAVVVPETPAAVETPVVSPKSQKSSKPLLAETGGNLWFVVIGLGLLATGLYLYNRKEVK